MEFDTWLIVDDDIPLAFRNPNNMLMLQFKMNEAFD